MIVTKKYGDATEEAKAAIANGAELVAGYGGDGTQHEIVNAVLSAAVTTGRRVPIGILPGGTGNGFAREMNTSTTLRPAVEVWWCLNWQFGSRIMKEGVRIFY